MKVLIIEAEDDLRAVMGFYVESELGIEALFAGSFKEAKAVLNQVCPLDAAVCDFALPDGTAEDVFNHLKQVSPEVPFILCGMFGPETYPGLRGGKVSGYVPKDQVFEKLKEALQRVLVLQSGAGQLPEVAGHEYLKVRTDTVLKFGALNCDLFIQLPNERYVRVYRGGDVFESEDFERFRRKKVSFLYVLSKDLEVLFQRLKGDLMHLSSLRAAPLGIALRVSEASLEVIGDFTRRFGFAPDVQELTKANIDFAVKNIQQNAQLAPLLDALTLDPGSYACSHSVALAYLSCGIASLMGWKSEMTFYKLTLAAFLHDLTISNPELTEIQALEELNARRSEFSPDEIRAYMEHPLACSILVQDMREIPFDVDTIILQHHERPDGCGFPAQLNNQTVSPLSAVFILSHELLHFVYRANKVPPDHALLFEFLGSLSDEYNRGYFKDLTRVVAHALVPDL